MIHVPCRWCNTVHSIQIDPAEYIRWQKGELIQDAMPQLPPAARELLISGTCDDCWRKLFPPEVK
jgi:hypothetical protein